MEQRIKSKILEAEATFDLLPGIVIIHHLQSQHVIYMSKLAREGLNVTVDQLREMGTDYHRVFFNPDEVGDYVPKILGLLQRNNNEEFISFFQQVRVSETAPWKWWLSSIRIFMQDDQGMPLLTLTVSIPVDPEHNFTSKVERLLQENNYLRQHKQRYADLTKREKEIIVLMARDKSSVEMAGELFLSEETIKTHRRNIKKKIAANNQYDVVQFAQAFNLV